MTIIDELFRLFGNTQIGTIFLTILFAIILVLFLLSNVVIDFYSVFILFDFFTNSSFYEQLMTRLHQHQTENEQHFRNL